MTMKLEELFPKNPEFRIASKDKTYTLRICKLEDKARFKEILSSRDFKEVFEKEDLSTIAKLVYRILIDKADFQAETENFIDDDGHQSQRVVTGSQMLLRAMHSND